ncbi:hypothetical protein T492DRAFT_884225 [Pavlovales sp. CCMP2436]|nr:hypothetical protein T492DRAFT_884225 [Pavlovales sp. CCMP2436]
MLHQLLAPYCTLVGVGTGDDDSAGPVSRGERSSHGEDRPYACDEPGCEYRATKTGDLTAHKRTRRAAFRVLRARVRVPGYSGGQPHGARAHAQRRERPYTCDEPGCEYGTSTSGSLTRHKRTHSGERPYACDEPGCKYRAMEAGRLTAHKRTHSGERPHACDEPGCKYRATKTGDLTAHKRTRSGERPFACDEPGCEYRATQAGSLTAHKRTHSGERPYTCDEPGCDIAAYKRTHSGEGPYACDEPGCEYRTTQAGHLAAHKRMHSGEWPFACDEPGCEYGTSTSGSLTRHKRTHSGERPYACDEPGCQYRATRAGSLTAHKRTHSGERPYARMPFSSEDPLDRTPSKANEGVMAAPVRFQGNMARSGGTSGKHKDRPHPSGPTFGRGAAGNQVPAASGF